MRPTQPFGVRLILSMSILDALASRAWAAVINLSSAIRLATTSRRSRAAVMLVTGLLACGFCTSPASIVASLRFSSDAFLL